MPRRPIDNRLDFLSPVSLVPGLGPKRIAALRQSGIETIRDLLYHFPRRYIDRSNVVPIGGIGSCLGATCCVIGTVTRTRVERGRTARFRAQITDDTGSFEALWFRGIPYFRKAIRTGQRVLLTGTVSRYGGYQMAHPLVESVGPNATGPAIAFLPRYPLTEAMREVNFQQRSLQKSIAWVVNNLKHYPEVLPKKIERKKGFPPLSECLRQIHMPDNPDGLDRYLSRLRYEELYQLALTLRWSRRKFALPGRVMRPGAMARTLESHLPFVLTGEQNKALRVLHRDAAAKTRMHRLLEGDVGSGKTVVAFFACLPALNEGMQVAWMAPTEVLAQQTYDRVCAWLKPFDVDAALLKGGISSADKGKILKGLSSGNLRFVVGTHALLQPSVRFYRLGMIVIDEQHRFGAGQRLQLAEKDPASDFLVMSATPIPQTLARTLYGDLEVIAIRSLPEGRQPVSTHIVPEHRRGDMETYLAREITGGGRQAFYLAPRIEGGDANDQVKDVHAVFDGLGQGPLAAIPRDLIHGRMAGEEKVNTMARFARGETRVLVATTLVEVGIDVPNATMMVIENAERFGLSQLHQLRGRVARGAKQGYCFLLTAETIDDLARERLEKLCATHDGFAIADLDLRLRGPGDVVGFRQSGRQDLKVADIVRDADLFREIQEELDRMLVR
ncbi:MAG: DEAD/DEAH box helicase [Chitinivibrionales bacterium]|nr:DEAD/DEAH box helicase [Chitinivibrionales bacterium]MBD3394618.1 DEAD/DEAH box helicase [Chitinivibrionales bacterium]